MSISNKSPQSKDIIIYQRSDDNTYWGETHISGSSLIFYIDSSGHINADTSGSFYTLFPPSGSSTGGSGLITGSTVPITASWAISASWAPAATSLSTGSTIPVTASWAITASFTLISGTSISASWSSQSIASISSSWASSSYTASFLTSGTYSITSSWAIISLTSISSSWTSQSLTTLSASWASRSLSSDFSVSSSWSSQSLSSSFSSYTPTGRSLALCTAYTPAITGADSAQLIIPWDVNGITPVSWSVKRFDFRVESSGSLSSSVNIEKSTGSGIFTATTLGNVVLPSNTYEGFTSGSLGSVNSGDKIRFNVITLGNSQAWTIITEISK
jgi:mating pheromone-induced death protein 2